MIAPGSGIRNQHMRSIFQTLAGRLAFWLTLPLLLPQALGVRRRALRLPAAEGPDHGEYGNGMPLSLLALGDSIIAGVGARQTCDALPARFAASLATRSGQCVQWHAKGQGGDAITELLIAIRKMSPTHEADVILVSIGVNEVTGLSSTRKWRQGLAQLTGLLRKRWPKAVLLFIGLPPMADFPALPQPLAAVLGLRAAHFDREMAAVLAPDTRARHVPVTLHGGEGLFCDDGFHPSEESYAFIGEVLADEAIPMLKC
jgi:lysophospholipase L1-like esterase